MAEDRPRGEPAVPRACLEIRTLLRKNPPVLLSLGPALAFSYLFHSVLALSSPPSVSALPPLLSVARGPGATFIMRLRITES